MTRMVVYGVALGVFVASTIMTFVSILTPHWASYVQKADNTNATFSLHLGLYQSCSTENDPMCRPFPDDTDCANDPNNFCSSWRSAGFLLSFSTVLELATIITFIVVMAGGKYKREEGWKVVFGLLLLDALVEFMGMGIVAYLYDHDPKFAFAGWRLGYSWTICTVSASVTTAIALGLWTSAYALPPEDDYEPLEDPYCEDA